jgi:hypothetical protein
MEQWEYLTLFLQASAKDRAKREFVQKRFNKKPKAHSPESMIPELDKLGQEGWELVHMQPVPRVGGKEDIQLDVSAWSSQYFCVFKRRKGGFVPVAVVPAHTPQTPNGA